MKKRRLWFGSLETRFYLVFTIIFFATVLGMQMISFRFTMTAIRDLNARTKETLLAQLVERIDVYIGGMERISKAVSGDQDVRSYLNAPPGENRGLIEGISTRLATYTEAREDVSSILIIRPDGSALSGYGERTIAGWTDYRSRPWYRQTIESNGETAVSGSYVQDLVSEKYEWVVSVSQLILSESSDELLGILLVDLKFNQIRDLCESLFVGDNGYAFILDGQGRYVFHPAQQLVYSGIRSEPRARILEASQSGNRGFQLEGRHYLVAVSEPTGWRVVSVSSDADLVTGWGYVQITYAIIGVIVFIVLGLITNFISQSITRPLHQLQEVMKSVETGEFREAGMLKATDEVRELAREYDLMVQRIRDLVRENVREQELKRKSDLRALQAQINPHFLYNTLDSIVWMAEMGKNEQVVTMTAALSRLFRISISGGKDLIRLGDELNHVRNYLTIQKMRYENRFRYHIDVDDSLLELTVLKIILQPLVENAIYHGIRDVSYPGLIEIGGAVENGYLRLWVKDNGAGMDQSDLSRLQSELSNGRSEDLDVQGGLGVRNVHDRIRLYFGSDYGLEVHSVPEQGTTIYCKLPNTQKVGSA